MKNIDIYAKIKNIEFKLSVYRNKKNIGDCHNALISLSKISKDISELPKLQKKYYLGCVHACYGDIYEILGKNKKAIKDYKKALLFSPESCWALDNLGYVYEKIGKLSLAKKYYTKAFQFCQHAQDRYDIWLNIANVIEKMGKWNKLEIHLKKGIKKINNIEIWIAIIRYLNDWGRYAEALLYCKKALTKKFPKKELYFNQGISYAGLNKWKQAIESYKKAFKLNPNDGLLLENLGDCNNELGLYTEAIKYYNRAIKLGQKSTDIHYNLGGSYFELKKYKKAIHNFNKAILLNKNNEDAWYDLACVFAINGNVETAVSVLKKLIKINPTIISEALNDPELKNIVGKLKEKNSREK